MRPLAIPPPSPAKTDQSRRRSRQHMPQPERAQAQFGINPAYESAMHEVDLMAYRIFIDSNGMEWQAWDVLPRGVERRMADRRVLFESVSFPERRRSDRRVVQGRWTP